MKQTSITTDGKPLIGDVFKMSGTYGLPLELTLDYLKERDMVVDWVDYIRAALADGHNLSTIKSRILPAVGDVYGGEYAKQFAIRLERIA